MFKYIITFFLTSLYLFAFDTKLYDKYYPIHKFNIENNKKLIIYLNETDKNFDNNYILDQFSFDYICSNPYFKENIDSNSSEALVILYDKFKVSFYIAFIDNCSDINELISDQSFINDNNELFIDIDKYVIYVNENNYISPFNINRYIDLCEKDELQYILKDENIKYIINIDTIEDMTLSNITLVDRCIN